MADFVPLSTRLGPINTLAVSFTAVVFLSAGEKLVKMKWKEWKERKEAKRASNDAAGRTA